LVYKELSAHLATNAGIEKPFQRNALLALIDFETSLERCYPSCESLVKSRLDLGLSGAVYILCVYGYKYGSTPIAFGDIGPVLEKFSEKDQREFLNAMPSFFDRTVGRQNLPEEMFEDRPRSVPKWIDDVFVQKSPMSKGEQLVCATSRMKIEYLIKSSMAENERRRFLRSSGYTKQRTACTWCDGSISNPSEAFCHACLRKLAEESLKAYGTAIENTKEMFGNTMKSTDIHPADDFVIIAAMCLVKLAGCIPCDTNTADVRPRGTLRELLQACAMLEFAHSHSTANKQTLILLVRLYQILGAGSLAMRAFARLGVKQIQLETLGYAILDRSSSLHPHAASDISPSVVDNLSPQYHIGRMNKLYKKAGKDIQDNIWRAFKEESYDSIFQFCDVADNLSKSLTAAMTIIESRRIDRVLKGMPKALNRSSHGYDMLSEYTT
jgi:N-terminal acetyltransferase B complex non-catalytic subunit